MTGPPPGCRPTEPKGASSRPSGSSRAPSTTTRDGTRPDESVPGTLALVRNATWRAVVLGALLLLIGAADAASAASPYKATIRRTAYGIPHIEAKTWEGLGYGYGYAFAQDDICTMAD